MLKGTLFCRMTRIKSVIYSRLPGRDPVLEGNRLTHVFGTLFYRLTREKEKRVIDYRSPGRDPVLKVDRSTRIKGTRVKGVRVMRKMKGDRSC